MICTPVAMSLYNVMYYTYVKPPNVCLPRCRHSCCCPDIFSKLYRWTPALRGVLVSVPNAPSSSFVHRCTHARECYSVDVVYTTRSGVLHICGRSTGRARGTVLLLSYSHVTNHPRPSLAWVPAGGVGQGRTVITCGDIC